MDSNVLPVYPYRDDGMFIYNAIKNYVSAVLKIYYGNENILNVHGIMRPQFIKRDKSEFSPFE